MGNVCYVMFYLAGGVFAAWGFALIDPSSRLIGSSGAIAAITTAYLALFPRSRVTVLLWFLLFIHFIEVPAMLLILLKIIVWDNVIGPSLMGSEGVAHTAHLAGYLFGFVGAILMLFVRALPRDQFDLLAVWRRWHQRRSFAADHIDGIPRSVARVPTMTAAQQQAENERIDRITEIRSRIGEAVDRGRVDDAASLYEELIAEEPRQCLSERLQLAVAREFYSTGRFPQAAMAFERFVACYPESSEATNVRLLLGIIYARDLQQYEAADEHLTRSLSFLRDQARRSQCLEWLKNVRTALGRTAPEV